MKNWRRRDEERRKSRNVSRNFSTATVSFLDKRYRAPSTRSNIDVFVIILRRHFVPVSGIVASLLSRRHCTPLERRARLPSFGYLTEIRIRVAGIKSYLDSDSAEIFAPPLPPPARLGEMVVDGGMRGERSHGIKLDREMFPDMISGNRFPTFLRSFRCQIWGTSMEMNRVSLREDGGKIGRSIFLKLTIR